MQETRDLSKDTAAYIESKRNWVRNHYTPESALTYDTLNGKLNLLDVILKSDWIQKDETEKLQSLGVTFGDAIVQDMNFIWIEVEDEKGTDPALLLPDTTIILFPMTMISKRIEKGESVNVYELFDGLKGYINEIKFKAN